MRDNSYVSVSERLRDPSVILEQQRSIRKGLIATTTIAFAFLFHRGGDINWVLSLSGTTAWMFVLAAHSYYFVSWFSVGGLINWRAELRALFARGGWNVTVNRVIRMHFGFTTVLGVVGFVCVLKGIFDSYFYLPSNSGASFF